MKSLSSFRELDVLGEALAKDYIRKARQRNACCFDIEGFITDYLGLPIAYESFAEEDTSKLGFISNGEDELMVWRNRKRVPVVFPRNTIVVERGLLRPEESCRRRFTLAHEAAHKVLEKHIPAQNEACFRSEYDSSASYTMPDIRRIFSMKETLTNRLGAAVIMPLFLVDAVLGKHNSGNRIVVYEGGIFAQEEKIIIQKMANDLGVSYSALINRLKELKKLEFRPVEEYLEKKLEIGGALFCHQ